MAHVEEICPLCGKTVKSERARRRLFWLEIGATIVLFFVVYWFGYRVPNWKGKAKEYARQAASWQYRFKQEANENSWLRQQLEPDPDIAIDPYGEPIGPEEEQEYGDMSKEKEEDFVEKFLESEGF